MYGLDQLLRFLFCGNLLSKFLVRVVVTLVRTN